MATPPNDCSLADSALLAADRDTQNFEHASQRSGKVLIDSQDNPVDGVTVKLVGNPNRSERMSLDSAVSRVVSG